MLNHHPHNEEQKQDETIYFHVGVFTVPEQRGQDGSV